MLAVLRDLWREDRAPGTRLVRIVSLLPSGTEIVCALGKQSSLVGVSHECDYPPRVRLQPIVSHAKVTTDGTSAVIDRDVRGLVERGLSIYELDVDKLRSLKPDVIITQDQCNVCAVPLAEVEAAVRDVLASDVQVVSLSPRTLNDVWRDIGRVAHVLGRDDAGATIVADGKARLATLAGQIAGFGRPVVACIEWLDPLMVAGNWMPDLVAIAGGAYPYVESGQPSRVVTWEELAGANPDVVIVMPCGFNIQQSRRELGVITARSDWRALPGVQRGRASVVDGNAYLNRPGPRLVESAEILAGLIHPDTCAQRIPVGAVESLR